MSVTAKVLAENGRATARRHICPPLPLLQAVALWAVPSAPSSGNLKDHPWRARKHPTKVGTSPPLRLSCAPSHAGAEGLGEPPRPADELHRAPLPDRAGRAP